ADEVERLGRVLHVAQQFRARDADPVFRPRFLEAVEHRFVGELADNEKLAVDHLNALDRENKWVADLLDPIERFDFLPGVAVGALTVDKLDRLEQPAWGFRFPNLTETACTQALDQPVPQYRLGGFRTE